MIYYTNKYVNATVNKNDLQKDFKYFNRYEKINKKKIL